MRPIKERMHYYFRFNRPDSGSARCDIFVVNFFHALRTASPSLSLNARDHFCNYVAATMIDETVRSCDISILTMPHLLPPLLALCDQFLQK